MSLFSFFRKNKQDSASAGSAFHSRAEEDSKTIRNRSNRAKNGRSEKVDPVLPEKKRARRRLVGAVALVLAAVIGLPMLLDSEPKPLADDIAINIPSRDEPMVVDGNDNVLASLAPGEEIARPPNASSAAGPADSTGAAGQSFAPTRDSREVQELAPAKAPSGEVPRVVAEPPSAPAPSPPAVTQDVEPKADKPAKVDESARALALLRGLPDPAAQNKSEKYVIQVAALATKENVEELQARLKKAGVRSYTEQISTAAGPRTRVRIGPFASKDEAEAARSRIKKLGFDGSVVPA